MSKLIQAGKNVRRNLKRDHWWIVILVVVSLSVFVATRAAFGVEQKKESKPVVSPVVPRDYVRARPASTTSTTTTTVVQTTTQPKPKPVAAPPVTVAYVPTDDIWDRLAECESSQDWSYNGGSGFDGGLQFSPATWTRMHTHWGVNTGYEFAWQAPREVQIQVAIKLMQVSSGTHSQWPVCSREIGMPNKF